MGSSLATSVNKTHMVQIITLSFAALMFSYLGVSLIRRWAEGYRILDIPNNRSSHTKPIPRGGGLAIVVVTICGLLIYAWLNPASWSVVLAYIIGALLVATVSWLDDLHSLPTWMRFAAHSVGAMIAIGSFGYWHVSMVSIPLLGQVNLAWFGLPATFLWIVGLTNAYNFMDGIDGIAGGQAVVAGVGWAVLGYLSGQLLIVVMGLLLAASSLGFLVQNWPPAYIFMGDVGSAFLGYSFALLLMIAAQAEPSMGPIGILLLWPFLFDTILTIFRRLIRRENIFAAHRSHLYQRLVITGATHRHVTLVYIGLALAGTVLSLGLTMDTILSLGVSMLIIVLFCLALWSYVVQRERKCAVRD